MMKVQGRMRCVFLFILAIVYSQSAFPAELRVIATIKPIHSLVASVMSGVGEPDLLIKGARSPHSFSLRPSEVRKLSQADVIFWIGEDFETFLIRPLKTLITSARVINLSKTPSLKLLPLRRQRTNTNPGKTDHNQNGSIDPHFWLNPDNAVILVEEIVRKLSAADNGNARRYAANGKALITRITTVASALTEILAPVKSVPFIVFHDAFQYFEKRYDLNVIGTIVLSPERAPGARKITEIRKKIISQKAVCVFSEPQFRPAIVTTIIADTPARMATLDPLGVDIPPGPKAYTSLLRSLARALVSCLGNQGAL